MINTIKLYLLLATSFLISCATTHPGKMGEQLTKNSNLELTVSGKVVKAYSDNAHQFLDFTFENKKTNWERIKSIEFKYGNDENLVYNVIVGEDLVTWANAFSAKKAKEDHNTAMALSGLMLAGAVLTLASGNSDTAKVVGATSYAAGATGAIFYTINEELRKVETSKLVPKSHLYSNFSVPAGMFVRRWVLVNVPGDKWATTAYLTINTVDGKSEQYKVSIN